MTPGSLTIGFNPTPGIFEVSESGEVSGIYGKLITEVAKRLDLTPVYVPLAFPALIPAVQSHRVDVNSGSFSITQPRAQILYYGTPWAFGPETIAVKPGTEIPSWEARRKLTPDRCRLLLRFDVGGDGHAHLRPDDACYGRRERRVGRLRRRRAHAPASLIEKPDGGGWSRSWSAEDPRRSQPVAKEHRTLPARCRRRVAAHGTARWKVTCVHRRLSASFTLQPPSGQGYLREPWEDTVPPVPTIRPMSQQ